MGRLSSFYIKKGAKFNKALLEDIEREVVKHSRCVNSYHIANDVILVNLRSGFESIFVVPNDNTVSEEKIMSMGCFPLSDGTLYSGFKYTNGEVNVLAHTIMLLIKYHLKNSIVVGSEDCEDSLSTDFMRALTYLNKSGYDIEAKVREDSRNPYIKIKGKSVGNEFDKDNTIFNTMFTFTTAK